MKAVVLVFAPLPSRGRRLFQANKGGSEGPSAFLLRPCRFLTPRPLSVELDLLAEFYDWTCPAQLEQDLSLFATPRSHPHRPGNAVPPEPPTPCFFFFFFSTVCAPAEDSLRPLPPHSTHVNEVPPSFIPHSLLGQPRRSLVPCSLSVFPPSPHGTASDRSSLFPPATPFFFV